MKDRRDIAILVGVFAVVIAAALLRPQQSSQLSTFSSYDTGRNGYRAVYEVMRKEGVVAGRLTEPLGDLGQFTGTIVVSAASDGLLRVRSADAHRLMDLTRGGARIVTLGIPNAELSAALGLPRTREIRAAGATVPARVSELTRGVRTVSGSFTYAFVREHGTAPVLLVNGDSVAVTREIGRGDVVAVTDAGVFSNLTLARSENARFAYDVLQRAPLLFDERLHGYASGRSMWQVIPATVHDAVWIALCVLFLAVFGAAFRSAPPVTLEAERPRDSSAYIAAMATLLRRARAGGAAIERFVADARCMAKLRPSISARPEIASTLAELERIGASTRPSDEAVLEAARAYCELRKEMYEGP